MTADDGWEQETREEAADDPMIGRVLGSRYRVEALLGKGAMGAVYRARHIKVGRPFAVKVLHERLLDDPKLRKRFEREAELAGKLHHINVIGVVDVGETEDGIHFMVMEFAEGTTLGSLVDGPMETKRAIRLAQQLCDGLQHAHEHGLIHRDFKPDNVIVEKDRFGDERPRIVDFGIAILREDAVDPSNRDRLTTAGLVLGTPHYMAPEHAMGSGIDHRIDLFALGVIMYELLTGWLPFDGDGVDVARANLIAATPAMGVRVPGLVVDPLLEAFTRLLMMKKPADRPESAKAARHLLDLIEKDRPMAARILGVTLDEPVPVAQDIGDLVAAELIATEPLRSETGELPVIVETHAMHRPVRDGTPAPARPITTSTPSSRAETVPEGGGRRTSARRDAIPRPAPAAPSAAFTEPRSRSTLFALVGAAVAIAVAVVVIAMRGPSSSSAEPVASGSAAHGSASAVAQGSAEDPHAQLVELTASELPTDVAPSGPTPGAAPKAPGSAPKATPDVAPSKIRETAPDVHDHETAPVVHKTVPRTIPPSIATVTPPGSPAGTTLTKPPTKPVPPSVTPTETKPAQPAVAASKPVPAPATQDTSANGVAMLYGQVGRELKALDTAQGPEIAQPLWLRFRQLRINDALASPEKRTAAQQLLAQLRRDIASRM